MATLDPAKNFAIANVLTGYAAGATTIVLQSGLGALLPDPSTDGAFNLVYWNSTDYANPSDDASHEIIRVTARSSDTLTVTRAQEGTTDVAHNTVGKQYKVAMSWTKKMRDDTEGGFQSIISYPEVIYNTITSIYTDDIDNMIAQNGGGGGGTIGIYRRNTVEGLRYIGTTANTIVGSTLLANTNATSCATIGGYHYVYIGTSISTCAMRRIAVGSDITSAGSWTTITLSGALFTYTASLIGYDGTNFWFTDGSTTFFKATLSGTTMTQGSSIAVTGSSYTGSARVNSLGIYAPFAGAPLARQATLAGAIVANNVWSVTLAGSMATPLYLYLSNGSLLRKINY